VSLRATGILALVALAVAAVVWWSDTRQFAEEDAEKATRVVLALDPESVTGLELPTDDGRVARLVRRDGSWRLDAPIEFPADDGVVGGILHGLEKLEAEGVIEERPDDLAPFGLAPGAPELRVTRGDEMPIALRLGGETPVGSDRYVARDDKGDRLYTVAQWKLDGFTPALDTLRDKRITSLEAEQVTSLRVFWEGNLMLAAARERTDDAPGPWTLVEPADTAADSKRLQRLLQDLVFGRAAAFVDAPGPLAELGLEPPELVVELGADGAGERIALGAVGEKAWAHIAERELVLEVPKRLFDSVPRELFAYRFKQVLAVNRDRVKRVELHFPRDETTIAFVSEDDRWVPEDDELRVESLKIDDLVWALQNLEAVGLEETSFEASMLGLDPPRVRVRLLDDDGEELGWLELGEPQIPEGMAARSSQGDQIWRVDNELGEDVPLGLEAFQNRWIERPEAGEAPEAAEVPGG
jgi:hypothetical protein